MLGAIAAVALVVGAIGATVSVTETNQQMDRQIADPVVEVQAVESLDSVSE